ncbi:MAG: hypothetical protein Q9196_006761, partial [Gyalolechia fulgens]
MEPAGLVIGVAGIASAFTTCIDCFEYVQLGRQFGRDYGKCLLRLDAAKVRLSRWGEAMGLGPNLSVKQQFSTSDENIGVGHSLLEQILESFEDAERVSERFKKHTSVKHISQDELVVCNPDSDLNSDFQRLHLTMRQLASKRQNQTNVMKKAKWALYEKKRFDTMIEDICGFINELVDLFPAVQEDQRELCKAEVSAISKTEDLVLLHEVAGKDDKMLAAEVEKQRDDRGHTFNDWKAG